MVLMLAKPMNCDFSVTFLHHFVSSKSRDVSSKGWMNLGLDDEVFVTRCLEGDQAAFTCLVSEYKEMVYAYAYHKLGDYQQAEDITQEVFIKTYRNLAQLKWPHKFRSWIYTIASNECKLWLREHSREHKREVSWEDVPADKLNELAVRNHSDEDIAHINVI
jgi:DNA-directed RNA polymerase specialized sigma24 family protein